MTGYSGVGKNVPVTWVLNFESGCGSFFGVFTLATCKKRTHA
jgi:hypothetical protein